MRKNKKMSIPMKLFVWFLTVTMMCTNISIPAFAEEFSAGESEEIVMFSDGASAEEAETPSETPAEDADTYAYVFQSCEGAERNQA